MTRLDQTRTVFFWTFQEVTVQRVDLGKLSEVNSLVKKVQLLPKVHILWLVTTKSGNFDRWIVQVLQRAATAE
jgi:hypothetical protein